MLTDKIIKELLWAVIVWSLILIGIFLFIDQVVEKPPTYFYQYPSFQRSEGFPEVLSTFEQSHLYGYTNQQQWID